MNTFEYPWNKHDLRTDKQAAWAPWGSVQNNFHCIFLPVYFERLQFQENCFNMEYICI